MTMARKKYQKELACGSSTVGFSLSVSFVGFVFLGCWCFLCFNCQLDVKLTCHLMYMGDHEIARNWDNFLSKAGSFLHCHQVEK
ncbi:hypothetical protein LWI28_026408 [Acer negundo]|uniref:Uncharacterized protein n=1 Tax=Acer negundo TaxID=4023 RepID=A0AAD5INA0_ACENE|nr:hypothetical protein LWI28_026408 [Acer negundo]